MMKLFPGTEPLESVAMDLLGPSKETAPENFFILVIANWFTKMTRRVPLRNTTAATVAAPFLKCWVYAYGAPQ